MLHKHFSGIFDVKAEHDTEFARAILHFTLILFVCSYVRLFERVCVCVYEKVFVEFSVKHDVEYFVR